MNNAMVLVVDDEKTIRKLASKILEGAGYSSILAGDGQEAVKLFAEHKEKIALAILDLRMPGMSGVEVFRKLNEMNPDIRVLLCSGYGTDDIPPDCKEIFIQKPFSLDFFKKSVKEIMSRSSEQVKDCNRRILEYNNSEAANDGIKQTQP